VLALLLLACSQEEPAAVVAEPPAACATAPSVTWDDWGHGFFLTWCASCHSKAAPDRRGAPEGMDFDTWPEVQAHADRVRARVLDDGTMPIGGGLYDSDLALLEVLLTCSR
jgi:uncharacterized membrane protein